MNKLNIINIVPDTVVDGPHYRTAIYFSGCFHKCKGCHNPSSWKLGSGKDYTIQEVINKVKEYDHKYITLSGGDPFCYQSEGIYELCKSLKDQIPGINIWAYTGFTLESLEKIGNEYQLKLLGILDGLVDGPFIEEKKSNKILFRGSENQIIWIKNKDTNKFEIDLEHMK